MRGLEEEQMEEEKKKKTKEVGFNSVRFSSGQEKKLKPNRITSIRVIRLDLVFLF